MARRKKKSLLNMILVLSVLTLAVFGGVAIYKEYNNQVRERATEVVKHTKKAVKHTKKAVKHTKKAVKHTKKAVKHVSEGAGEGKDEVVEALLELKRILEED